MAFADWSPKLRSVHQDTIVSVSMKPRRFFAAEDWILDGEEGEEETRTKTTMVKQVKSRYELSGPSRRRLSSVSVA